MLISQDTAVCSSCKSHLFEKKEVVEISRRSPKRSHDERPGYEPMSKELSVENTVFYYICIKCGKSYD